MGSDQSADAPALRVEHLVKIFRHPQGGDLRAVDDITFEVERGGIFGLLGPNGAGKTTTLEIIEGIQPPASGNIRVLGIDSVHDPDGIKRLMGVQLQTSAYPERLRLLEILDFLGVLYGKRTQSTKLLEWVGLSDRGESVLSKLSGGQARRFSIAASLVNEPEILFLDEPTSGLDPQGRRVIWEVIRDIRSRGTTVVLTTHYMDEAETLCGRVGIIDRGRLIALDTPLGLIRQLDSAYHIRFATMENVPVDELRALTGVMKVSATPNGGETIFDIEVHDPARVLPAFIAALGDLMPGLSDLRVEPATLEDVFLALTGHELRD